ncbi:hypothetical protein EDB86DRAFT_556637 [Lactarius hatsudake]|nr:hypothetical protein EDB86DRAFT_556637 [Lactarius hatsudake]
MTPFPAPLPPFPISTSCIANPPAMHSLRGVGPCLAAALRLPPSRRFFCVCCCCLWTPFLSTAFPGPVTPPFLYHPFSSVLCFCPSLSSITFPAVLCLRHTSVHSLCHTSAARHCVSQFHHRICVLSSHDASSMPPRLPPPRIQSRLRPQHLRLNHRTRALLDILDAPPPSGAAAVVVHHHRYKSDERHLYCHTHSHPLYTPLEQRKTAFPTDGGVKWSTRTAV